MIVKKEACSISEPELRRCIIDEGTTQKKEKAKPKLMTPFSMAACLQKDPTGSSLRWVPFQFNLSYLGSFILCTLSLWICEPISKEHLVTSHSDVRIYLAIILILRGYEIQIKHYDVFERRNANQSKSKSYWNDAAWFHLHLCAIKHWCFEGSTLEVLHFVKIAHLLIICPFLYYYL